ncbi:serine hydrolase [Brevibacterium daeguense]|nr:serine hydrolase [Brevibacterium daeguense]
MRSRIGGLLAWLVSCLLVLAPASAALPTPASTTLPTPASTTLPTSASAALPTPASAAVPSTVLAQQEPRPEESEAIYVSPDLGNGRPPPQPVAEAWLVGDLDTGEIFAGAATDAQLAPASVIKLLTALALVDELDDPEEKYEAVFEDMAVDGTKVGLMQQNEYTIDDLFHALLMASANDAAHALGNAVGGQEAAVKLMNDKAAELGLTGTVAANTSGLDAPGQVTTVADQMIIARAVTKNDYLMGIVRTEVYDFPGAENPDTGEKVGGYQIQNHTDVAGEVPGGLGLKNGYTTAAKGSFVAVVERSGKTYVSALLSSENSTRKAAVDLIDWAFNQESPEPISAVVLEPRPSPEPPASTAAAPADSGSSAATAQEEPMAGPLLMFGLAAVVLLVGVALWVVLRRPHARRRPAGPRR